MDAGGHADTAGIYLIQNANGSYTLKDRPADAGGGLPYDSYLCVQTAGEPGYHFAPPFVFDLTGSDGSTVTETKYDPVIGAYIQVVKIDSETGAAVSYPATWQIYSEQTDGYVTQEGADSFTSDDAGYLVLPQPLSAGKYALHEVTPPTDGNTGYLLNPQDVIFSVSEEHSVIDPLVVTMTDDPAMGCIEIYKTGDILGNPVVGATYAVTAAVDIYTLDGVLRAAEGDTVATITTDIDGYAITKPLYLGDYLVYELAPAPDGYLLDEATYPVTLAYADALTAVVTQTLSLTDKEVYAVAIKYDSETNEPVADTAYSLERSTDGGVTWMAWNAKVTQADGQVVFSPLLRGDYRLTETRPNPNYMSCEETGAVEDNPNTSERYFTVDDETTEITEVFYNRRIEIGVQINKRTIARTSAALDGTVHGAVNNVGKEEYLYHLSALNTTNVKADEFVITQDLAEVNALGLRITKLWTGTSPQGADFDGQVAVLYKTNKTDPTTFTELGRSALSPDFCNVNNPAAITLWSNEPGWKLWAWTSTTVKTPLKVADCGLSEDEYLTAIRFVYGDVDKGFWVGAHPAWSYSEDDLWYNKTYTAAWGVTTDISYAVVATTGLSAFDPSNELEMVIPNAADVDIARNVVLTDHDRDQVETMVIDSFSYGTARYSDYTNGGQQRWYTATGLPHTGDSVRVNWLMVAAGFALAALAFFTAAWMRRRTHNEEQGDGQRD
jgi:hypothetical protein